MTFIQHGLLVYWYVAAVVWIETSRGTLPPTRARYRCAFGMGVMLTGIGILGYLCGGTGTPSEMAAMALTGPIYCVVGLKVRSRVPRRWKAS